MGAVGRWEAAGAERGLWARGKRQVVFIISAFIHEKKILRTPTKISAKNNTQKYIHHVPTANVPLPRGGPYPTVFPNIIEVFHCRRIRCLSFMINCLSFIARIVLSFMILFNVYEIGVNVC